MDKEPVLLVVDELDEEIASVKAEARKVRRALAARRGVAPEGERAEIAAHFGHGAVDEFVHAGVGCAGGRSKVKGRR